MQSYLNAAARTDASLIKFPPDAERQASLALNTKPKQQPSEHATATIGPDHDAKPDDIPHEDFANEDCQGNSISPNKRQKLEDTSAAAISAALVDDDIDWAATDQDQDFETGLPLEQHHPVSNHQQGAAEQEDLAAQQHQTENDVETTAEGDVQQHKTASSRTGGGREVQHAVAEYVKALLDPFHQAGIVNREVRIATSGVALHCVCS